MTAAAATTTGKAYGKLILLGEHAVVFGAPALVVAIDLAVSAAAERRPGSGPWVELLGGRHQADLEGKSEIQRAYAALLGTGGGGGDVTVAVTGELPPGVGLGYSAAAGVAIARAVGALDDDPSDDGVRSRAMAWERVFHGNPSGVDVAAAMSGGCQRFTRAAGAQPVALGGTLTLCVGLSGVRSATRDMVARVARLRDREPAPVQRTVDEIGGLVDQGVAAVAGGDGVDLGALMNRNHDLLGRLEVSTPTLDGLCSCARDAGALGAKLTGAGGGGAVVALGGGGAPGRQVGERVVAAWAERGWDGFVTAVAQDQGPAGEVAP